jgi:hypothetical protein
MTDLAHVDLLPWKIDLYYHSLLGMHRRPLRNLNAIAAFIVEADCAVTPLIYMGYRGGFNAANHSHARKRPIARSLASQVDYAGCGFSCR